MIDKDTKFVRGETLTTEEFIRRARLVHGDKYEYPAEYIASRFKIKIICKHHGQFTQTASDHLSGHGCRKCKYVPGKWSKDEDEFLFKNYKEKGAYFCAEALERSEHSIRTRATTLGFSKKQRTPHPMVPTGLWNSLISRVRKDGYEFDFDEQFIYDLFLKQDGKCALTGWKINFDNDPKNNTVSVDRIDSTKGYTKDNVQLTNKLVNRCKLNCPEDLFYDICKSIYLNRRKDFGYTLEWQWDVWNDTERPMLVERNHVRDYELFYHPSKRDVPQPLKRKDVDWENDLF